MSLYGDGRDLPPTELELEEERAGYEPEPGERAGLFDSPLSIAGIGPGHRRRREPPPNADDSGSDPA